MMYMLMVVLVALLLAMVSTGTDDEMGEYRDLSVVHLGKIRPAGKVPARYICSNASALAFRQADPLTYKTRRAKTCRFCRTHD